MLMALAVLAMGGCLFGVALFFERYRDLGAALAQTPARARAELLLWCVGGTALVVAVASLGRMLTLRGGGAQIAQMLGGRLISGAPRDVLEKRLLNVVEEMAIASGVPVPQVFVLDAEQGINAFAAGFSAEDAAVAVTRGGLEKLTREELQGVVAHEFSHVLNGDMLLNLRLVGIVFGIVCIGLCGRMLMRLAGRSAHVGGARGRRGNAGALFFFVGLAVFLVGTVGELFGKLIRAAVSRQREFLADASAVQFTRNPSGIAGALQKIGGYAHGATVTAPQAEEASHFFFGDIHTRLLAHSVFATHPPLAERIARVDPSFSGKFPEVGPGVAQPDEHGAAGFAGAYAAATRNAAAVVAQVGTTNALAAARSRQLLAELSPALRDATDSPFGACAIVYALLLSDSAAVQQRQREQLDSLAGARLHAETLRMQALVRALPRRERLPVVTLLAPALRALSAEQRAAFGRTVQALTDADATLSIFEYVVVQTLRARASQRSAAAAAHVRHRSLRSVQRELTLLLSLLAHAGAADADGAARAFAAGTARLPGVQLQLLPMTPHLLPALGPALQELHALCAKHGAEVVDACAHAILADARVTDDEDTLLRAVCDALGCPLPLAAEA